MGSLWLEMDAPFSDPLYSSMISISHINWRVELVVICLALARLVASFSCCLLHTASVLLDHRDVISLVLYRFGYYHVSCGT